MKTQKTISNIQTNYEFCNHIRDNEALRASFHELTQKTFGFDFEQWYQKGHWRDQYIPHVLIDNGKVVSNVSVNLMHFVMDGESRNYIQLGTVMTDPDYRGRGLNKYIMERILQEYGDKTDGFYLFGNDSVLEYYPKFGFESTIEYEYSCLLTNKEDKKEESYKIEKTDISDEDACRKLYDTIKRLDNKRNLNDGFYMSDNLSLYQFWLPAEYEDSVYYIKETESYVLADVDKETLILHQIFAEEELDIEKLANAFGKEMKEVRFGYTPSDKSKCLVKEFKEEDSTLFIMGDKLKEDLEKKIHFPVMSHA